MHPLSPEMRRRTACVIHHPVTRVITVEFGHAQYLSHQAAVPVPPDQPGDLPVGSDFSLRYFLYDRQDLVDQ